VSDDVSDPVPIPADIDRPDKILAGLTARQVAIAATAAVIVWAGWVAARHVLPVPVFAVLAAPVALAATALVTGERDGLSLDRLLAAAWRQARSPRRLVTAPEGIPASPAWAAMPGPPPPAPALLAPLWRHIGGDGVIGLGSGGAAAVAAVSTVNFALRSPAEQDALTAAYGRWLNSLTGPVQVVIRAGRADLTGAVTALREAAGGLPHPALEAAALEHAEFLAGLAEERDVLTRQVLLVIREPAHGTTRPGGGTAAARAAQRAGEAARLLAGADLQVRVLDGGQVTALLAACADPAAPATAGRLAVPGQPVTGPGRLA
jgi:PrgI family protein